MVRRSVRLGVELACALGKVGAAHAGVRHSNQNLAIAHVRHGRLCEREALCGAAGRVGLTEQEANMGSTDLQMGGFEVRMAVSYDVLHHGRNSRNVGPLLHCCDGGDSSNGRSRTNGRARQQPG